MTDVEKNPEAEAMNAPERFQTSEAPPPSYKQIQAQLRAAKEQSSNPADYFARTCLWICNTVVWIICVALFSPIPIAMIVIGAVYLHDCPREYHIPIYLVVGGSVWMARVLWEIGRYLCRQCVWRAELNPEAGGQDPKDLKKHDWVSSILSLFLFAWFIAGSVWIFSIYGDFTTDNPPSQGSPPPTYCSPVVYYFAFWITIAQYILFALCFCCLCCTLCLGMGAKGSQ